LLSQGKVIGWHQGAMEFGPRALGNRSILANPLLKTTQKTLNLKIKYRESFRPFAPSILLSDLKNWFNLKTESPYMLIVDFIKEEKRLKNTNKNKYFGIKKLKVLRSIVPAVTHIDYSSRIQTINKYDNLKFYKLLNEFKRITKCPMLANTSFNIRGEPLVCSPIDAFNCFMGTEMDFLCIGNFILDKRAQVAVFSNYKHKFGLD
jgi:carbamoyltransferase